MLHKFKGSAIHNLKITRCSDSKVEGIFIGKDIMEASDIYNGETVIITRIGADSWSNRIKTVAYECDELNSAIVSGSLTHFLEVGDMTCIITEFYHDHLAMDFYTSNQLPIFDLGFDPRTNTDNAKWRLNLQYSDKILQGITTNDPRFKEAKLQRCKALRMYAKSMICELEVNKTHYDCLQGSAELPTSVMNNAKLQQYQSVTVYNISCGGAADTYAVPMPEGIVMTTGAMASFAKIGEKVNVISYILSTSPICTQITYTDGTRVIHV